MEFPRTESEGAPETDSLSIDLEQPQDIADHSRETSTSEESDTAFKTTPRGNNSLSGPESNQSTQDVLCPEVVIDALLQATETRGVSDEEQRELRSLFGFEAQNSMAVRLRHIQSTVEDLVAYRDAFEVFLDEQGEPLAIIDEMSTDIDEVDGRAGLIEKELTDLSSEIERIDNLDSKIDTLTTQIKQVTTQVEDTEAFKETTESVREDLEEIHTTVAITEEHLFYIGRIRDRQSEIEQSIDEMKQTMEDELVDLRDSIDELDAWRMNLSGALQGNVRQDN